MHKFSKLYDKFLESEKHNLKYQTYIGLKYNFDKYILPYFKNKNVKRIKKIDILNWKNIILESNFSNSYNNTLYVDFTKFLDFYINIDIIKVNHLRELGNFRRKNTNKLKRNYYELEEFDQFIKGFDKEADEVYIQYFNTLFFAGLRPSEAMALKFSDLEDGYITVNKSIQRKGKRAIDTPKSPSSYRKIKIDDILYQDLLKLKSRYIKYKNINGNDLFVFGGIKPLSPSTIDRKKDKACEKTGVKRITQHQFRHSHITLLMHNGMLVNEVSRRVGHSKPSITLDIYTHTSKEQEKRVYDTLNSMRSK